MPKGKGTFKREDTQGTRPSYVATHPGSATFLEVLLCVSQALLGTKDTEIDKPSLCSEETNDS